MIQSTIGDKLFFGMMNYGKRPTLKWTPTKKRQATVERRIVRLLKRYKSFFIDTGEDVEDIFIAFKVYKL